MRNQIPNPKRPALRRWVWLILCLAIITGCAGPFIGLTVPNQKEQPVRPTFEPVPAEVVREQPEASTQNPTIQLSIWIDDAVPTELRTGVIVPAEVQRAKTAADANLFLQPIKQGGAAWVYALVAPFATIQDGVDLSDVQNQWQGHRAEVFNSRPLWMSASTRAAFVTIWGAPADGSVEVLNADELLERAWAARDAWALIPFEEIQPRWKVLRVDGFSPLDKNFDPDSYPLMLHFGLQGDPAVLAALDSAGKQQINLPTGNRDPQKMTVMVMTGVTALVRATGAKMEKKGMTYPGKDIRDWLRDADLTHISNEIAFSPNCPLANPNQDTLQFCSRPEYIELLEDVGTDIIEMTGNHIMDWNSDSLEYTFQMYQQRGWQYYAAGENIEQARAPIKLVDHGNKIAMLGCNPVGPPHVWATETTPGAATCDYEWMHAEITKLRAEGYLPIVTFQYFEYYTPDPRPWQEEDFKGMADAGAVIVSGSQAHTPQAMTFQNGSFIHYGLGNLFFDQMDVPVKGTRREFIERHIFYNGKYIGTELLTAMLEEYARPRPMTEKERTLLLKDIFVASGWLDAN